MDHQTSDHGAFHWCLRSSFMGSFPVSQFPLWLSWYRIRPAMQETWVQSLGWEDPLEKKNGNPIQYWKWDLTACCSKVSKEGSSCSRHPEAWLKEEANRLFRVLCSHIQCIWGWGLVRRCYHWRRARLAFSNQMRWLIQNRTVSSQ